MKKAEDSNGFMGSAWSGFKNLTGIGDSSDKVREKQEVEQKLLVQFNSNPQKHAEIFKKLTGRDYTPENLLKFIKGEIKLPSELALNGYKEGQEMAVDVGADIVSGVAAAGIYTAAVAAAPFTGGTSIAAGVVAATATGAAVKTAFKAGDAVSGGREYRLKDAGHDAATGAFSGVLAPVTGGMGGAVGKTVATKLGVQAVKTVGKEVAEEVVENGVKQTVKKILTNPTGYEYVGGTAIKRAIALGAEMAVDGAAGGAVDNAFRTAIDGCSVTEIMEAAGEGAVGGLILSPAIGGGIKAAGKTVSRGLEYGKHTVKNGTEVIENKLNDVHSAKSAKINQDTNEREIVIPKVRFRAPSSKFAETDEAFRDIVRLHQDDFIELNKKSGDEFIREAFRLCKKYMGLEDAPIKLEIGDWSSSEASASEAIVRIGRNWKNGNKSELLGAVAHELNHMFQYKEMHINTFIDGDNYDIHPKLKEWIENQAEFFENNNQYYYDKGHVYSENFANYIEPDQDMVRYKNQPVEVESHRRGDLVRDEFKNLISSSVSHPPNVRLGKYEQAAAQKIADYFSNKYPNITQEEMTEIINDAVTTMKQPEFANMHYEQFVRYFISLYD